MVSADKVYSACAVLAAILATVAIFIAALALHGRAEHEFKPVVMTGK